MLFAASIQVMQNDSLTLLDFTALLFAAAFVAFGAWSLHQRFRKFEEWTIQAQALVMGAVALFYICEIIILRILLRDDVVFFIFSLLGLLVAGTALYGHIAVSLLSRVLVELIVPDKPNTADMPRLGPAEALESKNEWEDALNEYYILARIYPHNALVGARIANNLCRLERFDEAVSWFNRAIKYSKKAKDCLAPARRLTDTLQQLNRPEEARQALKALIKRFPGDESITDLAGQLELPVETASRGDGLGQPCNETFQALESLENVEIDGEPAGATEMPPVTLLEKPALEAMNDIEAKPAESNHKTADTHAASGKGKKATESGLFSLDAVPLDTRDPDEKEDNRMRKKGDLEALEDAPIADVDQDNTQ